MGDGKKMSIINFFIVGFQLFFIGGIRRQQTLDQHFPGEIFHRTFQCDLTVAHNGNMGGNVENLRQTVGDINDADASGSQVLHDLR